MKAICLQGYGGPDVMVLKEMGNPEPARGQVRIQVAATSVNRADLIQREGQYPPPPGESEILGLEVAGTIDKLGADVHDRQVGERVMSLVGGGGYAEYALAWADHLLPIPQGVPFEQAACLCETYITAFLNVFLIGGLQDGQVLLVHGGGGGVNTAVIQLAKLLTPQAKIAVTTSSGKVQRVQQLGVNLVIDYVSEDFTQALRTYTSGKGADVILDHIGAGYLAPNMRSLAVGGRLVVIGLMGGRRAEVDLGRLMVKRQQIIGSVLRSRSVSEKARIIKAFSQQVLPLLANGSLQPLIDSVFPLAKAQEAHRRMAASQHFGKIVLQVAEQMPS